MTDQNEPSKAVAVITQALHWAYDQTSDSVAGLGSAAGLADKHLRNNPGDRERAIDELIAWQAGYAGAAGFVSNLGGLITMPVAIPANLASVLLIQLRMIAAIAHLRGYQLDDERVRTLAFVCLTGSAAANILEEFSVSLGIKLSSRVIMQISRETLLKINRAVGFRLVAKAGSSGLINLTKLVPLMGGLAGGAFDAMMTRGIGAVAKQQFSVIEDQNTSVAVSVVETDW